MTRLRKMLTVLLLVTGAHNGLLQPIMQPIMQPITAHYGLLLVMIIASLRNEDDGGIENLSDRFRQAKQQLCTCITLFLHISLQSLHDYNVKLPNFTFCRGREQKQGSK